MTKREETFIVLASLYALNRRDEAVTVIRRSRLRPRQLAEFFLHLSLLLGFPTMLDGFEKLALLQLLPISTQSGIAFRNNRKRGLRVLRRVYGSQTAKLLSSLEELFPGLSTLIVEDVYGKVIARPGLLLRERELVNVTVLTIQGLNRQLHSHVRGALRQGVTASTLSKLFWLLKQRFRIKTRAAEALLKHLA